MSVRSRILVTTAWGLMVILPLGACAGGTFGSGEPAGTTRSPGKNASAKPSPTGGPTTTSSQPSLDVNFDGLPAPQACDPAAPKLVELGRDRKLTDNPYVQGGGGQLMSVDLGNDVTVSIKVYARDPEQPNAEGPITTYFNELKACFEIRQGGPAGRFDEFAVEAPEATLLGLAAAAIGVGPGDLRARRDELIRDNGITVADGVGMSLDEVVAKLGGDSAKVLSEARTKALANIDAALASGSIAPEQAAALKAAIDDGQLDLQFRDPEAAILVRGPDEPGEMLLADPRNLVIELEAAGRLPENAVAFFAVDPRIYQGRWQYYSWVKQSYVSSTVKAAEGEVCGSLWRDMSAPVLRGVRCPIAVSTSTPMEGSSTEARWFTVRVYGVYWNEGKGNYYELFGTWRAS